MDINEILPAVDLLITDYSGIYLDFLLCDNPVMFIPYDLKQYQTELRGLLFDYDLFTPGSKIDTLKNFIKEGQIYLDNPVF